VTMEQNKAETTDDFGYAFRSIHTSCCLAGAPSYLDDIRAVFRGHAIVRAIRDHDMAALFDWLIEALSFQGFSDAVASGYMAQRGTARCSDIVEALSLAPSCPKLGG